MILWQTLRSHAARFQRARASSCHCQVRGFMQRTVFQVCAFAVAIALAAVIADVRRKPGMTPFFAAPWLMLQKAVAVTTLGIVGFILARQLTAPDSLDWLGLLISAVGMGVAAKGKSDLARSHAWAGYFRANVPLVRDGIYSRLRNPIYCGIFLCLLGSSFTTFHDGSVPLAVSNAVLASYLVVFLLISAHKEQQLLRREFGSEYEAYASDTPAFVPSLASSKPANN
jgi:protein-S-isoprenylcysteine O-methyltransferase Ste14